jgi:hypothetical protein
MSVLSRKTTIILGSLGILIWGGLFALFYFSSGDSGEYSSITSGAVRGASVSRFQIKPQDTLIDSERAGTEGSDVLLIVKNDSQEEHTVYILRNQHRIVFKQEFSQVYTQAKWDIDAGIFIIQSQEDEDDVFTITPTGETYELVIE